VGASGSVIDLIAFSIMLVVLPVPVARALAIWVAMTWNFYWNRRWTFYESREPNVLRQHALFCGACLIGATVSWATSVGLWHLVPFFVKYPIAAALIGIMAGTLFNFVASSRLVFRSHARQAERIRQGDDCRRLGMRTAAGPE